MSAAGENLAENMLQWLLKNQFEFLVLPPASASGKYGTYKLRGMSPKNGER